MKRLQKIYDEISHGSLTMIKLIYLLPEYDISETEIKRLIAMSPTADEFEDNWYHMDTWKDKS